VRPDRSAAHLGADAYRAAAAPAPKTPWAQASWCVVDLELTGLDPRRSEIVSFGAVPIEHGRVQLDQAVTGFVRPSAAPTESSIVIHGIRAADLLGAEPLPQAIDPLLAVMAGRALVAHVATVEKAFLARALSAQGLRLRGAIADTSVIGRLWLCERDGGSPPAQSLHDLARTLGLPAYAQHDALGDALTAAQIFIAAASHLDAIQAETVRSLARAGRRLDAALLYPTAQAARTPSPR
jgi:DNA polymerase-3 subunit epsilon